MAEQAASIRTNAAKFLRDEATIDRIFKVGTAAIDDPSQVSSFRHRYTKLERLFDGLTEAFTLLCIHHTDPTITDAYTKRFVDAETTYIRIREIHDQLCPQEESKPGSDRQPAPAQSKARLPRLELPKFTGDIKDWPAFSSVFLSLVDTDGELTNSDKLIYLLTCVQGEAHTLVSHLRATDGAYPIAMDILRRRYENPRMLADTLIDRIMHLPHVRTRTDGLRAEFLNPLLESYKGLNNLGFPVDAWSYLLLHIALAKIDGELRGAFETEYGSGTELPTFDNLIAFLERQCRIMVPSEDTRSRRAATGGGRRSPRTVVATTTIRTPECRCAHCGVTEHEITGCRKFRQLAGQEKREVVQRRGLCYKCLGHHLAQDCQRREACAGCGLFAHHSLLHMSDDEYRSAYGSDYGRRTQQATTRNSPPPSPRRVTPAASPPTSPERGVKPGPSYQRWESAAPKRGFLRGGGRRLGNTTATDDRTRRLMERAAGPPRHPCPDAGRDTY